MEYVYVAGFVVLLFAFLVLMFLKTGKKGVESVEKKMGRQGERFAGRVIGEILDQNDILRKNIKISFDGRNSELDNVIINDRGVFIIEVKNFKGTLIGGEDDPEWIKNEYSSGGSFYQKSVKNPIRQVKRQIEIVEGCLKRDGIDVPVKGFVFFVEMNSPIQSPFILNTQNDIEAAIHGGESARISESEKSKIIEVIRGNIKQEEKYGY